MRYFICFLAAFSLSVSTIHVQNLSKLSPEQQEVFKVSKSLGEAANTSNLAAWSRQVADDCLFSDDDGILQTKARLMEHLMKLPIAYDHGVDPRDYVVHLYGDTAVVTLPRHGSRAIHG
jgi:Domain of unknown function (DUF4440)